MRRVSIAGLIAALTLATFVLVTSVLVASILVASAPVASAQTRPDCKAHPTTDPCWPSRTSPLGVVCKDPSPCPPVLQEWFSDLPWTQKLGTYRGNEIDEAFMLPYAALPAGSTNFCTSILGPQPAGPAGQTWQARCMIETGVSSILGILRTDTLYNPADTLISNAMRCPGNGCTQSFKYCGNPLPCIEVELALSLNSNQGSDALTPIPFGKEPLADCINSPIPIPPNCVPNAYYGGYVITDGSTYAPQLPWYMSHYCDSQFPKGTNDVQDPVCYADYLSPMNDGFNPAAQKSALAWPNSIQAWSVFPSTPLNQPPLPAHHCPAGQMACTLVMGGFDLDAVPPDPSKFQYLPYNGNFLAWFNNALAKFPTTFSAADLQRHFPWTGTQVAWNSGQSPPPSTDLYFQAVLNPFQGQFTNIQTAPGVPATGCDVGFSGPTPANPCADTGANGMTQTATQRADHFLYPRKCSLVDLTNLNAANLRQCGLNYEIHHNGWLAEWPNSFWQNVNAAGMATPNQYGRTSFLFAGVPGMQMPVSFYKIPGYTNGLSVYEQVHNASLFSLYLPIANEADLTLAYNPDPFPNTGRNYADDFYHTLFMSNHMESKPADFAEGIRGKVLWHNEYRSQKMYFASVHNNPSFPTVTFPAAFDPTSAPAPYHNHTCDGCHVRNGSGVPIKRAVVTDPKNPPNKITVSVLDQALGPFMFTESALPANPPYDYNPYASTGVCAGSVPCKDYTFTGEIEPMKLVFFDLARAPSTMTAVDDSVYSKPLTATSAGPGPGPQYYNNKIMNFYGDSFHVTRPGYSYSWSFGPANANRIVDNTPRTNAELGTTYQLLQVNLGPFVTPPSCQLVPTRPSNVPLAVWPTACADVAAAAITAATSGAAPTVGFIHLNGKRLGNSGAIEAMPNAAIRLIQQNQINTVGAAIAGELQWNSGTRGGVDGDRRLSCNTANPTMTCYIGRFGWLGDRVSLEDQVANAAFVEMNMTTKMGYNQLYPNGNAFPVRYNLPNCGIADETCVTSKGNSDLLEEDVDRMADYARWLGSPTRSEFTVSLPDVVQGEAIFKQINCNQCHVIGKIPIADPDDTMLTKVYRDRLATHIVPNPSGIAGAPPLASPFLSYLGTDLLMHDMGYLSQVANVSNLIRDQVTGVVFPQFKNYVQKIRTPPLKGLRFNRFVTDSHLNTIPATPPNPACDFLLHDGRACDAIEAAFLHDGPMIKALKVIPALKGLNGAQLRQLRAFLYSL